MKRTLDAAEPSPVFLSREKRQRLALERRQAAVADQRRSELPTPPPPPHDSSSSCRHYQDRHRDRRDRVQDRNGKEKDRAEKAREKELEAIRDQYLGGSKDKKPKTVAKPRDRFRFDWASTDDTSLVDTADAPYQPAHGPLLLYGRGFLAGIDRREQKKAAAATLHKESGAAATYDALDMRVDTHWTAKRAEEMTERDWRILREDFGISYRGSRVPRPMRSWAESGLGAELLRNVDRAGCRSRWPGITRVSDLRDVDAAGGEVGGHEDVEPTITPLEQHGGKSQDERTANLDGFRNGGFNVLVATDLAARGIDVPEVAHVINYEMPSSIDLYTHRIGRTGRAGKKGLSTSFLTLVDTDIFFDLKQMLVQSNSPVPPELARHEASKFKPGSVPGRPPRRNSTVHADG
ncbi:DEAD-box ATP-dependent RNA helicase 21-like [Aegilops tauschii subsp. strangulata]